MNCLHYREQMHEAPDAAARAHIQSCPACAAYWNEHLAKHVLATAAAGEWTPPAGLVDQVMAALPQAPADPIVEALGSGGLAGLRRVMLPMAAVFMAVCLPRYPGLRLSEQASMQSWSELVQRELATSPRR